MLKKYFTSKTTYWGLIFTFFNGLSKLIQLLLIIYLGANLDEKNFGVFSLLISFQFGVMTFGSAGINENLITYMSKNQSDDLKLINSRTNSVFLIISLFASIIFLLIYYFLNQINDFKYLIFFPISIGLIMSYSIYTSSALKLEQKFIKALFFGPMALIILSSSMILTFVFKESLTYIFISGFLSILFFILLIIKIFNLSLNFINPLKIKEDLNYIFPFIIIAIFGYLSGYGYNLISISFLSLEQIGIYSFLLTISTAPQILSSSLISIYSPKFYKLYLNNNHTSALKSSNNFYFIIILSSFLISLIIVSIIFVSRYLEFPLNKYSEFYFYSSLILSGYLLAIPFWYNSMIIYIKKMNKEYMNSIILSGIIGLIIWILLTYFFNENGLYIGFLLQVLIKSLLLEIYIPKEWKNKTIWLYTIASVIILNIITYIF